MINIPGARGYCDHEHLVNITTNHASVLSRANPGPNLLEVLMHTTYLLEERG